VFGRFQAEISAREYIGREASLYSGMDYNNIIPKTD
jgi:hypothetical protein